MSSHTTNMFAPSSLPVRCHSCGQLFAHLPKILDERKAELVRAMRTNKELDPVKEYGAFVRSFGYGYCCNMTIISSVNMASVVGGF